MCGRYTYYPGEFSDLRIQFNLTFNPLELVQRFNIAPGQTAPVLRAGREGVVTMDMLRWGLVPSWAKDASIGYHLINARSETLTEKPAFKRLLGRRHCLVLANGFYEWRKDGKKKIPLHFKLKSGGEFTFPGLWDTWRQADGTVLTTYTVLTTTPNELVKPIHDRMPVVLDRYAARRWLTCIPESLGECLELLKPYPAEEMTAYEVSPLVNSGRVDSPECIRPATA